MQRRASRDAPNQNPAAHEESLLKGVPSGAGEHDSRAYGVDLSETSGSPLCRREHWLKGRRRDSVAIPPVKLLSLVFHEKLLGLLECQPGLEASGPGPAQEDSLLRP